MVRWDVERAPGSVQLLTRLGGDYGVPAQTCLERTGLSEEGLRDPAATVTAKAGTDRHRQPAKGAQ